MRQKNLEIGGRSLSVAFEGATFPGELTLTVDGKEHLAQVEAVNDDEVLLRYEGQRRRIALASSPAGTWAAEGGRTRLVVDARSRRASDVAEGEAGAVTPLFPATVAKLLVERGQAVDKGQGLVVVTAMKTEMTLSAPRAGRVATINFAEGDSVSPGDVLVEIDETEEASDE